MENREVDSLITGLALKHDLFPVYLNIEDPVAGVPAAYQLSEASDDSSEDSSTEESQSTLP